MAVRARVQLRECERCVHDMVTCRFSRPEGFAFTPGQYLMLTLDTVEGPETKPFSLAQAPDDPFLEITTRDSGSTFKHALSALAPGDMVEIAGPAGRLSLPRGIEGVVFLVGGVGITPVRSMVRDSVHRGAPRSGALIFGNRDEDCIPYREEFDAAASDAFQVVHVLEHPRGDWTGERGYIDADLVRRHLEPGSADLFVTAGPPLMVAAMERVLDDLGIAEDRRLIEHFGSSTVVAR